MAKIIDSDVESQVVKPIYSLWKIIVVGFLSGLLFSALTVLIEQYVIDPFFCRSISNVLMCLNSTDIAGNIALVVVTVFSIAVMIRFRLIQPLIVSVAACMSLWSLAQWTVGLSWIEILAWNLLLYVLTYLVFSWIAKYTRAIPVLLITLFVIVSVHVVANLSVLY